MLQYLVQLLQLYFPMGFYGITFGCSLLLMNNFFVFNRFHNRPMTKKLCGPLAHWYVTKWPAIANRFVNPASALQTMQTVLNKT